MNEFELWLQEIFLREEPTVTKDAFEKAFERWLDAIQIDEWLEYGQEFKDKSTYNPGLDEALNSGDGAYRP